MHQRLQWRLHFMRLLARERSHARQDANDECAPVDELELVEVHATINALVLGGLLVLGKLSIPVLLCVGKQVSR
jgi:hypothetical protein